MHKLDISNVSTSASSLFLLLLKIILNENVLDSNNNSNREKD